jgi:hypothetical protein
VIEAGATFEFCVAKKPGSPQLELIGTLSAEDEATYQKIFTQYDEMRSGPRVRYGFGQFYIEPAKTKSDSIKPNQTNNFPGCKPQVDSNAANPPHGYCTMRDLCKNFS